MGIGNPVLAYWFDEVVEWHGRWVESHLAQKDSKGKPLYTLEKLLGVQNRGDIIRTGDQKSYGVQHGGAVRTRKG
jgi:hypothetical protein